MNGAVSGLAAGTAMDASGNIADMSGFELLAGTVNADTITGGDGTWDGGEGLNTLDGGTGSMSLTGRAGTDIFAFSTRHRPSTGFQRCSRHDRAG
jgi:Ca2+-binding RTX toxin-like protein